MQSNAAASTPATPVIMAKTPNRRRLSKVEQTLAEVDHHLEHCGPQMGKARRASSAPVSTKSLLEEAMTEAENGQWRLAMSKVRRAK